MTDGGWVDVERELHRLAAADEFSGSVLVTEGDARLLECGAGWADRAYDAPVTTKTRFGLASLSKMFTAAAVLSCVREDLLSPHDRVVDLVPAPRRPHPMAADATLHHLLTHTSGIGDYAGEDEDLDNYVEDYGSLWADRPSYRMQRPLDYLPMYGSFPPIMKPGFRFQYCNAGYVLLGQIPEEVTGQPVIDAIADRVLTPAGMADSGYFRLDEARVDVATAYLPRQPEDQWRTNVFSIPVVGSGDGGAFSTPRDVDRFLRSVACGRLLGDEMTRLMETRHVRVSDEVWMDYGLFVHEDGSFGHGGGDPGIRIETMARHWPSRDLTIVVLWNQQCALGPVWELLLATT
ncbi:MAG TPA: serine hydrolase domain-containing protein [Actinomycetota bacterium]|nr:serine hydrolase domain-containing protein [Actinomycetota bacterium]HRV67331.1 serine hydrolase domain-containing protein [Candidatus Nanopelagicales bacterium]